jgi:hypothetical protein
MNDLTLFPVYVKNLNTFLALFLFKTLRKIFYIWRIHAEADCISFSR